MIEQNEPRVIDSRVPLRKDAAGEVQFQGASIPCPKSFESVLKAQRLQHIARAGLEAFAAPNTHLKEFSLRNTSRGWTSRMESGDSNRVSPTDPRT